MFYNFSLQYIHWKYKSNGYKADITVVLFVKTNLIMNIKSKITWTFHSASQSRELDTKDFAIYKQFKNWIIHTAGSRWNTCVPSGFWGIIFGDSLWVPKSNFRAPGDCSRRWCGRLCIKTSLVDLTLFCIHTINLWFACNLLTFNYYVLCTTDNVLIYNKFNWCIAPADIVTSYHASWGFYQIVCRYAC